MHWALILQALMPITTDLALKLVDAIQKDDTTKLTPEDWIALGKHSDLVADERLAAIIRKHLPQATP